MARNMTRTAMIVREPAPMPTGICCPAMPSECQAIWLANAQAFVQQAKIHNIQAIFFQTWPSLKPYGVRLYNSSNVFTGYQLTSAGKYIFSLAGA